MNVKPIVSVFVCPKCGQFTEKIGLSVSSSMGNVYFSLPFLNHKCKKKRGTGHENKHHAG